MTVGKLFPLRSVRSLSVARQLGKIDAAAAARGLRAIRARYLAACQKHVYAECNLQMTGLVDVLPVLFPNSKTVFMIRDGRDWVRSYMNNKFALYTPHDPLYYFPGSRPQADMFPGDPFCGRWRQMSLFQRLCWLWRFHITYALKTLALNPNAMLVHFERLFDRSRHNEEMNALLRYVTAFPDGFNAEFRYNGELADKKFHEAMLDHFPKWQDWPLERVREFEEICGGLLRQQGYGAEPLWQERVAKAGSVL
jgi:hypothetical protein